MTWLIWAILLLAQNAAFTANSRARNSGSILYSGVASIFSNGIWMLNQVVVVDLLVKALASRDWSLIAGTALFYTAFTTIGTIGMHWLLMKKIERGNMK